MDDALAPQPGHSGRGEQRKLAQIAKGNRQAEERQAAYRHGHRHALQYAPSHDPAAHRYIVEGKGERAEGGEEDSTQEILPPEPAYGTGQSPVSMRAPQLPVRTGRQAVRA